MKKVFRLVQFGANLAIIAIGFLLLFLSIEKYVIPPSIPLQNPFAASNTVVPNSPIGENLIGKVLPLQGVDWSEHDTTVVVYLSTKCHFCTESSPFYQRLALAQAKNNFKLIAVLPQNSDDAAKYLEANNIKVDRVLSSSLSSVGITGTPTLMLVSSSGVVFEFWRGKLDEKKEAAVLAKLAG